jgi:hypothetical protein
MVYIRQIFFCLLVFCFFPSLAQEHNRITGTYKDVPLQSFLDSLRSTSPLRIYYKPEWINDLTINYRFLDVPLKEGLQKIIPSENSLKYHFFNDYTLVFYKEELPFKLSRTAEDYEILVIGDSSRAIWGKQLVLSGYIREVNSGRGIAGATVTVSSGNRGVITNEEGYFTLNIATGEYLFTFGYLGYQPEERWIKLYESGTTSIDLYEKPLRLKEIEVRDTRSDENLTNLIIGSNNLSIEMIEKVPAFLGEVDVIRSVINLPGVTTVGDGSAGFNVRGGNADQNMILLDEAPIFNSAHLFGFFSLFNPDVVDQVDFYRGLIPARFGGGLSSVLDIHNKEANFRKVTGSGGIGIIFSRLLLEVPLVQNKTSVLLGGRSTYSDWILRQVNDEDVRKSGGGFYDANFKITHKFSKSKLSLSGYLSSDRFNFASDTLYAWKNRNLVLKHYMPIGSQIFAEHALIYSGYQYEAREENASFNFKLGYELNLMQMKGDYSLFKNNILTFDFGYSASLYRISPGKLEPFASSSTISTKILPREQAREFAGYFSTEFKLSEKIALNAGLRANLWQALGPANTLIYKMDQPRTVQNVTDTLSTSIGSIIKSYPGIEPRLGINFRLNDRQSLKFGYTRSRQFLHLISNTMAINPLDIWQLSNYHLEPQVGNLFSAGYFQNSINDQLESSAEVYYKSAKNVLDYKDGAQLLLNDHLETDLLSGEGKAYGVELMIRKKMGKLNGWINYTFSRSLRKFDNIFKEEQINQGRWYAANEDRPNMINFFGNWEITRRHTLSINFNYATGRPVTAPVSTFLIENFPVVFFENRNELRIPDYHRMDLSFTVEGNHKKNKIWSGSWTFSVYNLYGRKNAFSVFFRDNPGEPPMAYRFAVLGVPLPSVTYNFKF